MKGVILSAFYLTTSIVDFLNGILYAAIDGVLTETQIIWLLSSMMLFISFIFLYVNYSFKPKSSDEFTNSIDMSEMSKGKEKNNNSTSKGKEKSILDDKEQIGA